jgi:hypothetical protein
MPAHSLSVHKQKNQRKPPNRKVASSPPGKEPTAKAGASKALTHGDKKFQTPAEHAGLGRLAAPESPVEISDSSQLIGLVTAALAREDFAEANRLVLQADVEVLELLRRTKDTDGETYEFVELLMDHANGQPKMRKALERLENFGLDC